MPGGSRLAATNVKCTEVLNLTTDMHYYNITSIVFLFMSELFTPLYFLLYQKLGSIITQLYAVNRGEWSCFEIILACCVVI